MLRRRFGRTEIEMPVFSCGGMRYQHNWKDCPLDEVPEENQKNLEATIHRSVELGINHIETASGYGSSERQLGLVLPTFPRDEIIVQTKIGPKDDPEEFRKEFEESLNRLQLDHVDLLAIHGINEDSTFDQSCRSGGCLDMAFRLRDEGKAKFLGFSTHGPTEIITKAIEEAPGNGFDYVNLHWYYIFQDNWPSIEAATRKDMGVFIISPTDKGGMLHTPTEKLLELCSPYHPIIFNDLFCLMQDKVHTLSLGAAKPSDFDLHMEAVGLYEKADEIVPPIIEKLEAELERKVGSYFVKNYRKNLPKWHETPGDINMHVILWLRNLALAYDMVEYGKMRYNLLGNAGHWFPGNKADKIDEAGVKAVIKDSPCRDLIIPALKEAEELLGGEEVKRLSESESD